MTMSARCSQLFRNRMQNREESDERLRRDSSDESYLCLFGATAVYIRGCVACHGTRGWCGHLGLSCYNPGERGGSGDLPTPRLPYMLKIKLGSEWFFIYKCVIVILTVLIV